MTDRQAEDDDEDEELQRYWDLWGMTRKEQERFGSWLMTGTAGTAAVIVTTLLAFWLMR